MLEADAEARRDAGAEVVHQHVGLAHEVEQHREVCRLFQIEHQTQLAAVHTEKRAALGFQRGRVFAQIVASRRLDLDDLGALVGEQGAAVWPGDVSGQVENTQAA